MAKYFTKWKLNPTAPWPKDPGEYAKIVEGLWAGIEMMMKRGEMLDWGAHINTNEGYAIMEGDAQSIMKGTMMFYPWVLMEPRVVLTLEETRKNTRELWELRARMK